MVYGITDLGTIFIVLLPGQNSLYVMTVASRLGITACYRGAVGGLFIGFSAKLANATLAQWPDSLPAIRRPAGCRHIIGPALLPSKANQGDQFACGHV